MGLSGIALEVANLIESRPLPATNIVLLVPDDEVEEQFGDGSYGYAEGQSFIIEYMDAAKKASRRPITVFSIDAGANGVPILKARCHLRKSTRAFRIDRIKCCIDFDGEIFDDVLVYLVDNFGMHPAFAAMSSSFEPKNSWAAVLDAVRDDAIILAAVAHSDGQYHPSEADMVTEYLCKLAERKGAMLAPAEVLALSRYANKLRPNYDRIFHALSRLQQAGTAHCERLIRACVEVMDADGSRKPQERQLINEISIELLGAATTA
ncbi:hypothetical protein DEM27_00035 [Metarhizobium album]|uniref:Co-chaperone DjlA N-terminal domain-containing protein n=1 Tax=Metarhizobium album TaxID=2182425 RepID=A0A2U2DWF9_9HYPH|nr:TerB family tellurite resistance protein [Rhizobium album]PWE57641.1 hypothetical protein DEM27_00035 [Rhizobium album]